MFTTDPWRLMLAGLLAGVVFGFLLNKGRVTSYPVIVGQFLFADFTVLKVMLTAILVGGVGVYGMLALGWIDGLLVKPAYLVGVGVGGLVFGVGMVGLGYCPGTAIGALGAGSRHALIGLLGGIVGAAVFTEVYPLLSGGLMTLADFGKVTLADQLGVSPFLVLAVLAAGSLAAFFAIHRYEAKHPSPEAT